MLTIHAPNILLQTCWLISPKPQKSGEENKFRTLKNLSDLSCLMSVWIRHYVFGEETQKVQYLSLGLSGHERNYGLGMDVLVSTCSCNTKGFMAWAWMFLSAHALVTRQDLWFGHGCSGQRMFLEHERNMVWAWMLWSAHAFGTRMDLWLGHGCSGQRMHALGTRTELWFGHGCSRQRMLLGHKRNHGLGMDALVGACSWNTNGIVVWAWMLSSTYVLGTRTELWFGHGCSSRRML